MNDDKTLYVASLCAATSLDILWKWQQSRSKPPFPPGPKRLPLLGNVLDVPKNVPIWRAFQTIARNCNTDVLYLKLLTKDHVILNSAQAVSDLFEKRSNIYSDRPLKPMLDLMDIYSWAIPFMEYGNLWRNSRRLLHEFLNPRAVTEFDEYQRKHAYRFLARLADSPEGFLDHAEFAVAALVMEVTYSFNITTNEDQFLRAAIDAGKVVKKSMVPGSFLIDTFPIMKYVPEWFPGAGFKTFARVARGQFNLAVDGPLDYVKEMMKSDESGKVSIAWSCIERALESTNQGFDDNVVRAATGTIYVAAVGNTTSVLQMFFLAMVLNPHVLKKAQEELDRVVGSERLPDLSDQEDLPYIFAIIKEVHRWGCPAPIGIPKRVIEDDVYNGYFIPAGATVIENIWAMCYDESVYPKPHKFDPERYLKKGKLDHSAPDPDERVFGSGRRICPGKHFALRTLFLDISCILSLFNVEAPIGEKIEAKFYEPGFVRHPAPFKCTIKPRTQASSDLIRAACAAVEH